ncbi:hypothetical protein [Peptoniphilus stercorisuis]|uniref:Conjugative transposon protein TcpC n=1 Tax=Peptoniphilus stercorisuis TaxID=1436965 RepID=A0ABS4KF30_9FIRM|nr:hypothetical protein [Peptoniphilus stercorisuis]MBP2025980.1 hypothetical protein [Peptoniphilus stercorisuis]
MERKKSIFLKIVIVLLIVLNVFWYFKSQEDTSFIEDYLNMYYSQVTFKEDTLLELQEEISDSQFNEDSSETKFSIYQKQYSKFLTNKLLNDFSNHGQIPNFDLINYGIKNNINDFNIKDLSIKKKEGSIYSIKYNLVIINDKEDEKILNYNQIYKLKKEQGILKIDYIGEEVGNK